MKTIRKIITVAVLLGGACLSLGSAVSVIPGAHAAEPAPSQAGKGLVLRMPLAQGVSVQDAIDSMKLRANLHNIKLVNELPLYKQVEAMTGKPYRFVEIFEFCDPLTAAAMLDYNGDYAAFMPCRIALYKDAQGKAWVSTMNLDVLMDSGKQMNPELRKKALQVRDAIYDIMKAGANGEL